MLLSTQICLRLLLVDRECCYSCSCCSLGSSLACPASDRDLFMSKKGGQAGGELGQFAAMSEP
jgi:hypothetical protein